MHALPPTTATRARWSSSIPCVDCMCLSVFTGAWKSTRLGNGHKHHRDRGRAQKWRLSACKSPERVPTAFCPSGICFKISKLISFTYSPGAFQTTPLVLILETSEFVHKPFKRSMSVPYRLLSLLDMNRVGFQSQTYWGFVSQLQISRFGVPDVGHEVFASQSEAPGLWDPSLMWGVGLLARLNLGPSYPLPGWPFSVCCKGAMQLAVKSFSRGTYFIAAVDLVCLWEEVSSGTSCNAILLQFLYYKLLHGW